MPRPDRSRPAQPDTSAAPLVKIKRSGADRFKVKTRKEAPRNADEIEELQEEY
jgi:hypothetical protein